MGRDKIRTYPYKASTNGAVERDHRILNVMLGRVVCESQRDWDVLVLVVMAACRASRHQSTGYSQNFHLYGREVRSPIDLVIEGPNEKEHLQPDDLVEEIRTAQEQAYSLARELRRLCCDCDEDVILCATTNESYTRTRPAAALAASLEPDSTMPVVRSLSVAVAAAGGPRTQKTARKIRPRPAAIQAKPEVRRTAPTGYRPPPSSAVRGGDLTPLLVGFGGTIAADLVGRIGRTVANYVGPGRFTDLDAVLGERQSPVEPNFHRALTLGVLAGAQEASRFGLFVMAAASSQYPDGSGQDEGRALAARPCESSRVGLDTVFTSKGKPTQPISDTWSGAEMIGSVGLVGADEATRADEFDIIDRYATLELVPPNEAEAGGHAGSLVKSGLEPVG